MANKMQKVVSNIHFYFNLSNARTEWEMVRETNVLPKIDCFLSRKSEVNRVYN